VAQVSGGMMPTINVEEKFKDTIDEIWAEKPLIDTKFSKICARGYAVQSDVVASALLFVGINPSFEGERKPKSHFYTQDKATEHRYFKKFIELTDKTGIPWTHFDLLFIREREQSSVKNFLKMGENGAIAPFFSKQIMIAAQVIELAKPKAIVVNNTLARDLLYSKVTEGWRSPFTFEFDQELGTPVITAPESLKRTPVFFTSMLTGQRALDNGSFERLVWHINFVKRHFEASK
jgi:hypothetical protein